MRKDYVAREETRKNTKIDIFLFFFRALSRFFAGNSSLLI